MTWVLLPLCWQMDRASILGDAIEYLKELLQRINDLHNELESTPSGSSLTPTASFHPLTPTPSALPSRIMDKLCPSSLPSPNGQPARVILFSLYWDFFLSHLLNPRLLLAFACPIFHLHDIQNSASKMFKGIFSWMPYLHDILITE